MYNGAATVLHIEDIVYFGDVVRVLIGQWPEFEHVGHAANGTEGLALGRRRSPDIVLLDLGLPDRDGFEVARELSEFPSPPRVLLLTLRMDDASLYRVGHSPVAGMIFKNVGPLRELRTALGEVAAGRSYFQAEVREAIRRMRAEPDAFFKILSASEISLLPWLGFGLTDEEIAAETGLTPTAIRSRRQRIMAKLGLHGVEELMRWCSQKGFSDLSRPSPSCVLAG